MKRIILASASPRRKELLALTGLKFTLDTSGYEEEMNSALDPRKLAKFLSLEKAKAVAGKYTNAVIIAADTFIVFKGKILGKPHTEKMARRMLSLLNGKIHSVITGFTILDTGDNRRLSKSVVTKVYLKRLTRKEIDAYVKSREPLDKAGGYAIQGLGSVIVKKIEGDYFNVIGLPLSALMDSLKRCRVHIL
ncbi:MAG: Maf family protein [Thermodesulfovibrionales bacterium]|jgi:septum formation protein